MSELSNLAAELNGNGKLVPLTSGELCKELTDRLGLADVNLSVVGATVFGKGPRASVDLRLSDGNALTFERFADVAKPATLSAYLVTATGVYRAFKGPEAGTIAAAIHRLADHQAEATADDAAREWGCEFLRIAPVIELDLNDTAERWGAFQALSTMNPGKDSGEDKSSWAYAAAASVLTDRESGERLVRAGWMQQFVKREVGGLYSPADLAVQMLRVGWQRRASEGWVKATCPETGHQLRWRFYTVAQGWEDVE